MSVVHLGNQSRHETGSCILRWKNRGSGTFWLPVLLTTLPIFLRNFPLGDGQVGLASPVLSVSCLLIKLRSCSGGVQRVNLDGDSTGPHDWSHFCWESVKSSQLLKAFP